MKVQYIVKNSRDVKALLASLQSEGKKLKSKQVESIRFLVLDEDDMDEAQALKAYGLVAPLSIELIAPPPGWVGEDIPEVTLPKGRRATPLPKSVHANGVNGTPIPRSVPQVNEARAASLKRMNALMPNA